MEVSDCNGCKYGMLVKTCGREFFNDVFEDYLPRSSGDGSDAECSEYGSGDIPDLEKIWQKVVVIPKVCAD